MENKIHCMSEVHPALALTIPFLMDILIECVMVGGGEETDGVSAVSPPVKSVGVSECGVEPPGQAVTWPLRPPVMTSHPSSDLNN